MKMATIPGYGENTITIDGDQQEFVRLLLPMVETAFERAGYPIEFVDVEVMEGNDSFPPGVRFSIESLVRG